MSNNPFFSGSFCGHKMYALDAQSRLDMVKRFDIAKCRAALRTKDLQIGVRDAIERRLKRLIKEEA